LIVEERIYTLEIGKVPEYIRTYEEFGLAIQTRILPRMLGYFYTEVGELNQVIHLWAYADLNERAAKRAELQAEPGWQEYLTRIRPLIVKQENRILQPMPFSPVP
jgi:hypothetical protein